METQQFNRRQLLKAGALLSTAFVLDIVPSSAETASGTTPPLTAAEIAAIEQAIGKKGTYKDAEATHTTPLPRNDLKVTIKGQSMPTAFGFGGWVSIKKTLNGKSAVLMSDNVLLQEEVAPLISAVQANGLEIGAIHNHFFYEEPRIFYMHVHGKGSPEELARKYATAIAETKIFPKNQPAPAAPPAKTGKDIFDVGQLNSIIKNEASVNGPTIKYTVGRKDLTVIAMGAEMTPSIGLNTWAAFSGSMEEAHIAGDVAMLDHEVNPVIKTLRSNGLEIVAVHNHMLADAPHLTFLHYYGKGAATSLAKAFRQALDQLGRRASERNMNM